MPSGLKAWTRASRPPAWPLMWPRIASACWPPRPARCSWSAAWRAGYLAMAALVVIGIATALIATEPAKSATAAIEHAAQARENPLVRVAKAAYASFAEFLTRNAAILILVFVVLYKLCDAFAGAMTAPFVIDLGFSRNDYAAIVKGVGLAAT